MRRMEEKEGKYLGKGRIVADGQTGGGLRKKFGKDRDKERNA